MKRRLDTLLTNKGLAANKEKAHALILAGMVVVQGHRADKPGMMVEENAAILLKDDSCPFVSRGGLKLAKGLEFFQIRPAGMICADIGASTGGFTDCLLQHGAAKVYAIDVGYGQLAWSLRQDHRVVVMERTNARHLTPSMFSEPMELIVIDAAFISLKLLLPPILPLFGVNPKTVLALIKPQFEVERGATHHGVVSDPSLHQQVIEDTVAFCQTLGLTSHGFTESPILGPKGNKEFLLYLSAPQTL